MHAHVHVHVHVHVMHMCVKEAATIHIVFAWRMACRSALMRAFSAFSALVRLALGLGLGFSAFSAYIVSGILLRLLRLDEVW